MVQDTPLIKSKILSILRTKGPCLPVHIAREIESDILFSSAFLSELVSEKRVKLSYIRVGNSPLYYLPGQEPMLERFSNYLKSKEKEAFLLLKEKEFLVDSKQAPAIRVALREIRDFAVPFKNNEEIIWRFFRIPENQFNVGVIRKEEEKPEVLDIFDKEEPQNNVEEVKEEKKEKTEKVKTLKKQKTAKKKTKEDKFFNKIKEFISKKSLELVDIESFKKNEIVIRIRDNSKEKILIAYNKKKITETDITKAGKKASEFDLPYIVVGLGVIPKKLENLIDALRNISSIDQIK